MEPDSTPDGHPATVAAPAGTPVPARRRLVETAEGRSDDAYGAPEWGLLAFTASV